MAKKYNLVTQKKILDEKLKLFLVSKHVYKLYEEPMVKILGHVNRTLMYIKKVHLVNPKE